MGTAESIRKTRQIGFGTIDIFAGPLEIDVKRNRITSGWRKGIGKPIA